MRPGTLFNPIATMNHEAIINRFLSYPLARFVRNTECEFQRYAENPRTIASPDCFKRDRVRAKLTTRAYNRYAKTL